MKETASESAALKMALKHDPMTEALAKEAQAFPSEADEAISEVESGLDTVNPESWVAIVRQSFETGVKIEGTILGATGQTTGTAFGKLVTPPPGFSNPKT